MIGNYRPEARIGQLFYRNGDESIHSDAARGVRLFLNKCERQLDSFGGGADGAGTAIEDVGVDHGCLEVAMPEEGLAGADIVTGLQKVGGKAMAEGVARNVFGDAGLQNGVVDGALKDGLVEMVTALAP